MAEIASSRELLVSGGAQGSERAGGHLWWTAAETVEFEIFIIATSSPAPTRLRLYHPT